MLDDVDDIRFVHMGADDVVRHKLVQRIVEAYDEHTERSTTGAARPQLRPAARRRG